MAVQIRAPISAGFLAAFALVIAGTALGQSNSPQELEAARPPGEPNNINTINQVTGSYGSPLLAVPMVNTTPGGVKTPRAMENPMAHDAQSVSRGMKYFISFNCVGCHAANGGGGMGPQLSDAALFKYGTDPDVLFLVISHGAPLGMPAWGTVLPQSVIWDLVSYIESINKLPRPAWGDTVSGAENLPGIEQIPAEFKQTPTPWDFTEPFSKGRKPTGANPTAAQSEPNISPR